MNKDELASLLLLMGAEEHEGSNGKLYSGGWYHPANNNIRVEVFFEMHKNHILIDRNYISIEDHSTKELVDILFSIAMVKAYDAGQHNIQRSIKKVLNIQ